MSGRKTEIRIGTSGYQYDHWRGVLYPAQAAKKDWFSLYADRFDTVEINNTFYHLPQESVFDTWRTRAPAGFRYTVKFSRFGSHIKRLKEPRDTIALFLERAERLRSFLGPILIQLPPRFPADPGRLEAFLKAAPRRCRWAFEFRHRSWLNAEVFALLRAHGAALCIHDMLKDHPVERTADWVYLRFHGPGGNVGRGYSPQSLTATARRIRRFSESGVDVHAFFNNDLHGHAVRNATSLKIYLGIAR